MSVGKLWKMVMRLTLDLFIALAMELVYGLVFLLEMLYTIEKRISDFELGILGVVVVADFGVV